MQLTLKLGIMCKILTKELVTLTVLAKFSSQTYTDTQPPASRLSLIPSTFILVFSANSDRRALVRRNRRRRFWPARACEAEWTAATPLFFSEPQTGERIRPPTAHVVPPPIPPHPFSLFAIPISSLPRTTDPTTHLFKAPIFIREQIEISSTTWQHLFCNIIFTLNR